MARIFLSSTVQDLRAFRDAVRHALVQEDHHVVGMGTYFSTGTRPVEQVKADIEDCDYLIGLVAWRRGFVPEKDNPKQKSITEIEFDWAKKNGVKRLFFLLDEKVPWPPVLMDLRSGDLQRVLGLREKLMKASIVSFFHDPDDLAEKVVFSLWPFHKRPYGEAPTAHLLRRYFADNVLSFDLIARGAARLRHMVDRSGFRPKLIVGLNPGGLVAASALIRDSRIPVGVVWTQTVGPSGRSNKVVSYAGLPEKERAFRDTTTPEENQILLVDVKHKGGESLRAVVERLKEEYGGSIDVRVAVVLGYGGSDPSRYTPVRKREPWCVRFQAGEHELAGFVAWYTDASPSELDPVAEL